MKNLFFYFILFLSLASCNKSNPPVEDIQLNNSSDSLTYQPKNVGSKWTYTRLISNILLDTFNFVSLSYDTTAYGNIFHVFKDDFQGNQFIRQDGGKYYTLITNSSNKPQVLVLDTSKNLNEWWVGGTNGNDTYNYKIVQRFSTYQLDNFVFKNVIKVYGERVQNNAGVTTITLKGDVYYAQGVGHIKSDLIGISGTTQIPVAIKVKNLYLK